MEDGNKENSPNDEESEQIELSAPWSGANRQIARNVSIRGLKNLASGTKLRDNKVFIRERSAVHSKYIEETEKTKRTAIIVGCLCLLSSAAVLLFAPSGKEIVSYVIAFVLFIVAAGAFGFTRVAVKRGDFTVGADRGDSD